MGRSSVVIVGAGIAGLASAWELSGGASGPEEFTPRIEIIESSGRCGGSLATADFCGRSLDLGADGFLVRRTEVLTLVEEVGLEHELEPIDASGAWIYAREKLHELPGGLVLGVPTDPRALGRFQGLSWASRVRARQDALMPRKIRLPEDPTIGEIVRKKLGAGVAYQLVEPLVGGIQAGRIDQLSAASVFPALLGAARRGGSLMKALRPTNATTGEQPAPAAFNTLRTSVGSLASVLENRLRERGVIIRLGSSATAVRAVNAEYQLEVDTPHTVTPANHVVMAAPVTVAGQLLGHFDPALARLSDVPTSSAAMITLSFSRADLTLPESGTGVLIPLDTRWSGEGSMLTTAVTFLDRKWPHLRGNDVLIRAHVGRSDDVRFEEYSDEDLSLRVQAELREVFNHRADAASSLVQRWPNGLPQYVSGHQTLVNDAVSSAREHALSLAGNAYEGVGIPASISSGRRAAKEALRALGATPKSAQ